MVVLELGTAKRGSKRRSRMPDPSSRSCLEALDLSERSGGATRLLEEFLWLCGELPIAKETLEMLNLRRSGSKS